MSGLAESCRLGTNVLRSSGARLYSSKVLEGNWVNDRKLTSFEGVRPSCETEVQIRAQQGESFAFFPLPSLCDSVALSRSFSRLTHAMSPRSSLRLAVNGVDMPHFGSSLKSTYAHIKTVEDK
jgi:hypothetical protein